MVGSLHNLEIHKHDVPSRDSNVRDSQITLHNEASYVELNGVEIEVLTPKASENIIPKFYHPFGNSQHTKAACQTIMVSYRRLIIGCCRKHL